jgi:hypothetical protein
MRSLTALLLVLACLTSLQATTKVEKRLDAYVRAARAAVAQLPPAASDTPTSLPTARYVRMLDELAQHGSRPSLENVNFVVLQLSALRPADATLRRAGDALLKALVQEREAAIAAHRDEIQAVLKNSAQACLAATAPADLDGTLLALASLRPIGDHLDRRQSLDHAGLERASQMTHFVSRWQELLAARDAGNLELARALLRELKDRVDPALIPRSKLLALEPILVPPPPTTPARANPKPPPDPAAVLKRLERAQTHKEFGVVVSNDLERIANRSPEFERLHKAALELVIARSDLERGSINASFFLMEHRLPSEALEWPRLAPTFIKVAAELRRLALAQVFRDSGLPQLADEPTDVYILRVARAAAEAENWEYTLRTLEFYVGTFQGWAGPAWTRRELESCLAYVAALRLEEAGQFPQAVAAYQEALGHGGTLTPVKLISTRLAAITAAHPDALAAADRLPRGWVQYPDRPSYYPPPSRPPPFYLSPRTEQPFKR